MAEEQSGERTEQPTPKRLKDSRDKGQIARSRELNAFLVVLTGTGGILVFGLGWVESWGRTARYAFGTEVWRLERPDDLMQVFFAMAGEWGRALGPFITVIFVVALLAPMLLGGWSFSGKALAPKFERIDPIKGMGRVFGVRGLVELFKSCLKFLVVSAVAALVLWHFRTELLVLDRAAAPVSIAAAARMLAVGFFLVSATLALIALIDAPYQLWDHNRKLRMTRQEVKDELKQTEGDPQLKARIRQVQREMARRRMMAQVPTADVIVTNPTHYAVALRYDDKRMAAPRVVAKGSELLALRIRDLAAQSGVTIVSSPLLARALYFTTPLDAQVPDALFRAVAQVLAYVYQISAMRRAGIDPRRARRPAADANVPDEYAELVRRRSKPS